MVYPAYMPVITYRYHLMPFINVNIFVRPPTPPQKCMVGILEEMLTFMEKILTFKEWPLMCLSYRCHIM